MNKFILFKNKTWRKLIGANEKIPTEQKIFNSVCVFAFFAILLSITFNFFIGFGTLAFYQAVFLFILAVVFYFSRLLGWFKLAFFIFAICNYAFLAVNYFYNMGLNGPTLLGSVISLYFLISITPQKMMPLWVLAHIVMAASLSAIQYKFPKTVASHYDSQLGQFIDINFTFFIIVLFIYMITHSIRSRYFHERSKVTQQKLIIEEKNARLEYIDRERNRLFSIISHDLRSPLTSINGYLELLNEDVLNTAEQLQVQQELLNLSNHTSEMLNNLLHWSRSQLEGKRFFLQNINLAAALKNTVDVQQLLCDKKNIHFTASLPPDLSVYADRDHLELVVRNLLSNAIKFTMPGGNIELVAENVEPYCLISIRDDGAGIDETLKPLIFSSEIKSSPGTHNEKGIGLGLYMCKEFVEKQGGSIYFESEAGKGTVFYVKLRAA